MTSLVPSIDIDSAHQTPFAPADAGAQALLQTLGSRIRGNERGQVSANNDTLRDQPAPSLTAIW